MWKLSINQIDVNNYRDKMLGGLIKRVQDWKGKGTDGKQTSLDFDQFRTDLLPDWNEDKPVRTDILVELLTAKPIEAYNLNKQLMKKFVQGYNEGDLEHKRISNELKTILKTLEKIFDYDGQISKSKSKSYWLAERIGRNTCTYCNRQYTFTVSGTNNQQRITRPEFDHWFPKSLFPLLSLNIYNLIPSCTICNSGAKGDTVFQIGNYVHPYLQTDDDPKFKFVPQVADSDTGTWNIVLERNPEINKEVDNTIKAFALDRIYDMHSSLEVKDLMDFAQAYSETYLQQIFELMKNVLGFSGYSREEIYHMLFGTEAVASKYLDRPLSKLKHDILEYLHII